MQVNAFRVKKVCNSRTNFLLRSSVDFTELLYFFTELLTSKGKRRINKRLSSLVVIQ